MAGVAGEELIIVPGLIGVGVLAEVTSQDFGLFTTLVSEKVAAPIVGFERAAMIAASGAGRVTMSMNRPACQWGRSRGCGYDPNLVTSKVAPDGRLRVQATDNAKVGLCYN